VSSRVLVVTNDLPPRPGGIQSYLAGMLAHLPAGGPVAEVTVYGSSWRGAAEHDAALPHRVVRDPAGVLLPTPRVLRATAALAREVRADTVWFAAAAPLGLLAPGLRRRTGITRAVASTHGHEVGWARLPGARRLLRAVGDGLDAVTYLGAYTRERLAPALGPHPELVRLPGGVDTEVFGPDGDARAATRRRLGLDADTPVVLCVSRLVARKGQESLVRALPALRRRVPGTTLLLVGGGPDRDRLHALAAGLGVGSSVRITGSVPWGELPAYYTAGDVFAMPCRTRRAGTDVEGLGIVYLEASATGLPVVAGDSGGAPDAVREAETGWVVAGGDQDALERRVGDLLADPHGARRMGAAGRRWVQADWRWQDRAAQLADVLAGPG